ncbi:hypothetical protein F0344_04020 [Streptomyces finlayi]|uniref:Fibronectin type III-like domain-containing protein n=1 Tax=Streptomyces finlayi TaxID=67296 RepID=A0A7G7BUP4_9ACTN|nr:hypothetical protein F0344_04020 [Streptomyces finlayi]
MGFRKVRLDLRETTRLTFTVPARDLSAWSGGGWNLVPGRYTVHAGRSSRDLPLQRVVTV